MRIKLYFLGMFCISSLAFTQTGNVGINTDTPSATLDINGNLKIRTIPASGTFSNYTVLGVQNTTKEVSVLDASLFLSGPSTNTTIFSAIKDSGITLLNLGLFPSGFSAVKFVNADKTVGGTTVFEDVDNAYVVPSDGVYKIDYSFRYGTGLQASILPSSPGVGIVRTRAGVATLVANRAFSGANLILVSATISESSINNVYNFQAGDRISFGVVGSSALSLGVLGSSEATVSIYKVSNLIP